LIEELPISQYKQMLTVDTQQWQSGLYVFVVKISGEEEHVGRFEIIH
jgi:hypothetical protein